LGEFIHPNDKDRIFNQPMGGGIKEKENQKSSRSVSKRKELENQLK
jgi:hypothetical protein